MNTIHKLKNNSFYFLVIAGLFAVTNLNAQGTSAKISGTVTSDTGEELIGATIAISNTSTGFATGTITDIDGTFSLRALPLGGPYVIRASYTGYQDFEQTGVTLGLGDHAQLNFTLKEGTDLETVVVTANNFKARTDRLGNALAITGKTIATIPTPTRNFEQLATLSPQSFVPDVGARNFGGAGQGGAKGGQTGYSIDGTNSRRAVFGGSLDGPAFTISQEAIREFEVQTNEYGVTNGRNGGGSISAVTNSGTNELKGGAWLYKGGGDNALTQDRSASGSALSSIPSQTQYGVKLGGALIKDKLFFFGVYDRYQLSPPTSPFAQGFIDFENSAFNSVSDAESFYGFTQSEAQSVLDAAETKGYNAGSIGNLSRDQTTQNLFLRLDYNINEKHKASLRYSWLDYSQTNDNSSNHNHGIGDFIPNSAKLFGTNASNYLFLTADNKIVGSLRSQLSNNLLNNLRVQFVDTERANAPVGPEQETRVYVGAGNGAIAFGQNTWVPEVVKSKSFQIVDDITYDAGDIVWTFGTNNQFYFQSERLPHFTAPVVVYDDVTALQNDEPSFYTQLVSQEIDLTQPVGTYNMTELGFYGQAEFDLSDNIKAEVGLRWDGWIFGGDAPVQNTALANSGLTFRGQSLDNSIQIKDLNNLQPRFQVTWDTKKDGSEIVKVGGGLFVAPITTQPVTLSYYNNGQSTQRLSFAGTDAILNNIGTGNFSNTEDWLSNNLTSLSPSPSDILMIDPNFEMPTTWKTSISYNKFLTDKIRIGISGFYNISWNDNMYVNANLAPVGNNPIDNRELAGTINSDFGRIQTFTNSDWRGQYVAAVFEFQAKLGKDGLFNVSYTNAKALGGTVYNSGGAGENIEFVGQFLNDRFKDHTNAIGNGTGQKVVATLATPTFAGFNIGFNLIAAKQRRFTITASGNPNNSNDTDIAYIPNVNSPDTDPILAEEFNRLLSSVAPEVRAILTQYQGQISGINAGAQPWLYQTSASISKKFTFAGKYGFTLRTDIFNVLNFLNFRAGYYNQVVNNGGENIQQTVPLFNWNGSSYNVNSGFGQYNRAGNPYQIQFGIKFDF